MSGTSAIGAAPPAASAPRWSTPRARSRPRAGRLDPVHGHRGAADPRDRRTAIPSGSTDFILTLKDPAGTVVGSTVDTGTSPEFDQPDVHHGRHVHLRDLGLPGRPRRLHVQGPAGARHRRDGAAAAVVLTAKEWGHLGGDQVTAEFKNPGATNAPLTRRRDRQGHRRQPGDRRHGRAHEHGRAGRRRDQRQPRGGGAGDRHDVPQQRRRRRRACRAPRSTWTTSSTRRRTCARSVPAARVPHRLRP